MAISFCVTLAASLATAGGAIKNSSKAVKTIRPEATLLYVDYKSMISQADAIFIGHPIKSLADTKGEIKTLSNGAYIQDYYSMRDIKITRVIKNNDLKDMKSGNTIQILERAVIANISGQATRLISEDYEELLSNDKYIFFIDRTQDGEYILFNGKYSKYNLLRREKDEIGNKSIWKERVLKDYLKELD